MGRAEKSSKYRKVSVWNWMGTIILTAIPVVNIIMLIILIATAKTRTRRNFAIASLVLIVLAFLLTAAAVVFFGEEIINWMQAFNLTGLLGK